MIHGPLRSLVDSVEAESSYFPGIVHERRATIASYPSNRTFLVETPRCLLADIGSLSSFVRILGRRSSPRSSRRHGYRAACSFPVSGVHFSALVASDDPQDLRNKRLGSHGTTASTISSPGERIHRTSSARTIEKGETEIESKSERLPFVYFFFSFFRPFNAPRNGAWTSNARRYERETTRDTELEEGLVEARPVNHRRTLSLPWPRFEI